MTTGRAIHKAEDGTETDITEGVQALYDLVINSMDWGSGFWTEEDAAPVSVIGHLLGFENIDQVDKYIGDKVHDRELAAWRAAHYPTTIKSLFTGGLSSADLLGRQEPTPHEHVLSSAGRCMWPRCSYKA